MFAFYLTHDSCVIFSSKFHETISFPPTTVKFQEIINEKAFLALFEKFSKRTDKQPIGIFLDEHIVYHKTIPITTEEEYEKASKEYFSTLPISSDTLGKILFREDKTVLMMGTNSKLYEKIAAYFMQHGWHVTFVVPVPAFSKYIVGENISYDLLHSLAGKHAIVKKVNLLSDTENQKDLDADDELSESPKKSNSQLMRLVLALLAFVGVCIYAAYTFGIIPFGSNNKSVEQNKTTTTSKPTLLPSFISPTSSPQATLSAQINRSSVSIQILNGSGIAGQATQVKDQLTPLGYTTITTGNSTTSNSTAATVTYSQTLSKTIRDEITQQLDSFFQAVTATTSSSQSAYDVIIVTSAQTK